MYLNQLFVSLVNFRIKHLVERVQENSNVQWIAIFNKREKVHNVTGENGNAIELFRKRFPFGFLNEGINRISIGRYVISLQIIFQNNKTTNSENNN